MTGYTTTTLNYPQLANTPIRRVMAKRSPTPNDKRNFTLGDEWLNEIANQWWKLAELSNITGALWILLSASGTGIISLTGNSGGAVMGDGFLNINVLGAAPVDIVGTPLTNTLTVNLDGTVASNYIEDIGTATPSSGNLNVIGGPGIVTTGAGNTVTIDVSLTIASQYDEDVGTAVPAGGILNIVGGVGVSTSGAGNTVTIDAASNVPTTFVEDVGSATPAANILNVIGGAGIATSGAGDTITITALAPTNLIFTENVGTATPAAGNINILGTATNGILTTGAGDTVTVAMNSPYADGDFEFRSTVSGQLRTLLTDNTSNTAASRAVVEARVAGTSAGDPWFQSTVGATRSFAIGASNANSQHLRINTAAGAAVSPSTGTNVWDMSPAGIRTMPLQPAFFAHVTADVNNVTGDFTYYSVICNAELFDNNSNYNTGTGQFTAPVSGVYQFNMCITMQGLTAAHFNATTYFFYNNINYITAFQGNTAVMRTGLNSYVSWIGSTSFYMTAGTTMNPIFYVQGGTKTVGVVGDAAFPGTYVTWFSGNLLY